MILPQNGFVHETSVVNDKCYYCKFSEQAFALFGICDLLIHLMIALSDVATTP